MTSRSKQNNKFSGLVLSKFKRFLIFLVISDCAVKLYRMTQTFLQHEGSVIINITDSKITPKVVARSVEADASHRRSSFQCSRQPLVIAAFRPRSSFRRPILRAVENRVDRYQVILCADLIDENVRQA
jgi:hypothetical protein